MKGLLWMGNGFLLLYKRFEDGTLSWPRTTEEAAELTEDQYNYLLTELPKSINKDGNIEQSKLEPLMPWSKILPADCYSKRRK